MGEPKVKDQLSPTYCDGNLGFGRDRPLQPRAERHRGSQRPLLLLPGHLNTSTSLVRTVVDLMIFCPFDFVMSRFLK